MMVDISRSALNARQRQRHILMSTPREDGHLLAIYSNDLSEPTELATYPRRPDWAAWSQDGEYVAIVHTEVLDASRGVTQVWVEIWSNRGLRILREQVEPRLWVGAWALNRPSLLLAAVGSGNWLRVDVLADSTSLEPLEGSPVSEWGYWEAPRSCAELDL